MCRQALTQGKSQGIDRLFLVFNHFRKEEGDREEGILSYLLSLPKHCCETICSTTLMQSLLSFSTEKGVTRRTFGGGENLNRNSRDTSGISGVARAPGLITIDGELHFSNLNHQNCSVDATKRIRQDGSFEFSLLFVLGSCGALHRYNLQTRRVTRGEAC